jgi:LuxR family maltose regulon positive regulatory protein
MQIDDEYVGAAKLRLQIRSGELGPVQHWVERRDLGSDEAAGVLQETVAAGTLTLMRVVDFMTVAELCLAAERPQKARAYLSPLLRASEKAGWTALTLKLQILDALALHALGHGDQACQTLQEALAMAEPEGYAAAFLTEGEPMAALLCDCVERGIAQTYARRLLDLAASPGVAKAGQRPRATQETTAVAKITAAQLGRSLGQTPLVEPLTDREQQILRLLTSHLTTTEMAEELFLSVNTVRTHIKHVYAKLDVHSRTEAVVRAQELGLL